MVPPVDGDRQPDLIQPSTRDPRDIFLGLYDGVKGKYESMRGRGGVR